MARSSKGATPTPGRSRSPATPKTKPTTSKSKTPAKKKPSKKGRPRFGHDHNPLDVFRVARKVHYLLHEANERSEVPDDLGDTVTFAMGVLGARDVLNRFWALPEIVAIEAVADDTTLRRQPAAEPPTTLDQARALAHAAHRQTHAAQALQQNALPPGEASLAAFGAFALLRKARALLHLATMLPAVREVETDIEAACEALNPTMKALVAASFDKDCPYCP